MSIIAQGRSRIDHKWETSTLRAEIQKEFGTSLFLGVCEWGPDEAEAVTSFDDYKKKFGRFLVNYDMSLQVWLFFKHGGTKAYIKRIFHIADHAASGTPASALKGSVTLLTGGVAPYVGNPTLLVEGKYYGALALSVMVTTASNGNAEYFDLLVYHPESSYPIERFKNLTMDTTAVRYAEDVINTSIEASGYITVTDLTAVGTPTQRRPINNVSSVSLTGGNDGLTSLNDADYIGGATYRTGLYGFNLVNEGNFLLIPDSTSVTVQNAAIDYCEDIKQEKVIFIPEMPPSLSSTSAINQVALLTASRARTAPDWPLVKINNPDKVIYGQTTQKLTIGTSAIKAGIMAKWGRSAAVRMWTNPSNDTFGWMKDVVGLEEADNKHEILDDTVRDKVTDGGINPVLVGVNSQTGQYGVWFDDCQTGENRNSAEVVSIGNQAGLSHLRYLFEAYLQRHRTQGNTRNRRLIIDRYFKTSLGFWTGLGAFATRDASSAFYVNVDIEGVNLNNPLVQMQQKLIIKIGLALADPARIIELIFTRDNRAVESYLQQIAAGSGNATA